MQNDYPMQTPSPGAFVTPSPSGYSHAAPPALPYRAPAPARGAMGAHAATPSTHPEPTPSQTGAGSSQRWKFMDDTGKLRKVSGRLFSEPSASLRFVLTALLNSVFFTVWPLCTPLRPLGCVPFWVSALASVFSLGYVLPEVHSL